MNQIQEYNNNENINQDFQLEPLTDSLDLDDYNRKQIDYINKFKLCSRSGNLKFKLNIELIFFTNLKSLRLRYIQKLDELNKQLAALNEERQAVNDSEALPDEISTDSAINSPSNALDTSSYTNRISKQSSLTMIDSITSHSEEGNYSFYVFC